MWVLRPSQEPVYGGKTLRAWLVQYEAAWTPSPGLAVQKGDEARDAVRQMGASAIPTLLGMLRDKENVFTPFRRAIVCMTGSRYIPPGENNNLAMVGFRILGNDAKSAVPALLETFNEIPQRTSEVLSVIGPSASNAAPVLVAGLTNRNEEVRAHISWALSVIEANGDHDSKR
jgi:hypothetical protein